MNLENPGNHHGVSVCSDASHTDPGERLLAIIEHAAHLLPAQGPITQFVHHNTLHAFEELPFEDALREAARAYRCQTLLSEEEYCRLARAGRIDWRDVQAVLMEKLGDHGDQLIGLLGTRYHVRLAMLQFPPSVGTPAELQWLIAEDRVLDHFRGEVTPQIRDRMVADVKQWFLRTLRYGVDTALQERFGFSQLVDRLYQRFGTEPENWQDSVWESVCLRLLGHVCKQAINELPLPSGSTRRWTRHRDALLALTGEDADRLVHEVLVRWCAAYIDQGLAMWQMPGRENGFYETFLRIYEQRLEPPAAWRRGLGQELRQLRQRGVRPLEVIAQSLELLGVPEEEWPEYIQETLLALRGFAGQIWQMEQRSDRYHWAAPEGSLVGYLAVRLILDRYALAYIAREKLGYRGPLRALRSWLERQASGNGNVAQVQRWWAVFQLAQALGWSPRELASLTPVEWKLLIEEIDAFSDFDRRLIWLLAFERRYYQLTLDALCKHDRRRPHRQLQPVYQVITCIDEREESLRRHLEEVDPACATYGVAGFFGVAMYYRGLHDPHFMPLCPVVIRPQTYVTECANYLYADAERVRSRARREWGALWHRFHVASRSFWGGLLAGIFGTLATIPLVMRVLAPRFTAAFRRAVGRLVSPPLTQLNLEATSDTHSEKKYGFTIPEMAQIVAGTLRMIGLTDNFSRLVLIVGHGSSSLNNPHEAAHDCGACGGARGGPNARAFAQMANDARVRRHIATMGIQIPDDVYFVGAYHNTCDDSIIFFDLHQIPSTHYSLLRRVEEALDEARRRNAHERCRRFQSADLDMHPDEALRHVEVRAEDLAQTRPEYGHCTNAICVVGRRERTRGLFMDRRAFLASYDCYQDPRGDILRNILRAVIPVCAGISLEYYFSRIDPVGFGCGTKLPHNITSLLGVMDGAASDLRTGLPWQMVELHESMRILFIIEAPLNTLEDVIRSEKGILSLVENRWVHIAALDPEQPSCFIYQHGTFRPFRESGEALPEVAQSVDWYRGWRDHLGYASVKAAWQTMSPTRGGSDDSASSAPGGEPAHEYVGCNRNSHGH
jgi:uncharacterized protein YbcC (UPF0753/DUF2309 family)